MGIVLRFVRVKKQNKTKKPSICSFLSCHFSASRIILQRSKTCRSRHFPFHLQSKFEHAGCFCLSAAGIHISSWMRGCLRRDVYELWWGHKNMCQYWLSLPSPREPVDQLAACLLPFASDRAITNPTSLINDGFVFLRTARTLTTKRHPLHT